MKRRRTPTASTPPGPGLRLLRAPPHGHRERGGRTLVWLAAFAAGLVVPVVEPLAGLAVLAPVALLGYAVVRAGAANPQR